MPTPRFRNQILQSPNAIPEGLPDYLRAQYEMRQLGEGGGATDVMGPGGVMRDSQGREVILVDEGGNLTDGRNLAWNEGTDPTAARRWDEDLGWVTDRANVNESPWETRHRGNQMQAAAMFAALAGGGLAAEAGLFGGAGSGGSFPMVEAPNMAIPGAIPAEGAALAGAPAISGGASGAGAVAGGVGPMAEMGGSAAAGGSGLSGLGSQISNYVTSNPMGALRTVGGLASMGAGLAGGRGGADTGGVGDMNDILAQQANANRYDWNTPFGSRSWERGEDGSWTVNDRMSEREQANFDNVQGMNADATGYARQLLARTMANPRRDYFADLPSTDSYFSRWRS